MKGYQILIIVVILASSFLIIQSQAEVALQNTVISGTPEVTELSERLNSLESGARDLRASTETTLGDIQSLEMWVNSGPGLSGGNQAEIRGRLDRIDSLTDDYRLQLSNLEGELAEIYGRLGNMDQSNTEVIGLKNRADRVRNDLDFVRETLSDIDGVRGRIDISRLTSADQEIIRGTLRDIDEDERTDVDRQIL